MITGNTQNGLIEQAFIIFRQMLEKNVHPNAVTLPSILLACNPMVSTALGKQLHAFAIHNHLDLNVLVGSTLVDMYLKIRFNPLCYRCITDMLGRVGRVVEAYEFVKELGEKGNVFGIWGSLLAACRTYGEFQLGKVVADKFFEMEKGNSRTGYHVLLSNIFEEEGNSEFVNRVSEWMQGKGLIKEVGCRWIDIAGYVNCLVHPQFDDICKMLEELGINMNDIGYRPRVESQIGLIYESEE